MQEINRCQDLWHYNKIGKGWDEYGDAITLNYYNSNAAVFLKLQRM